ncbi:Anaphase-promoting complex subunit 5 [Mortierella sp. NVP85]|nr:Anaphase-promoting complex subunit 5 [Mortierella sp. NVP85]
MSPGVRPELAAFPAEAYPELTIYTAYIWQDSEEYTQSDVNVFGDQVSSEVGASVWNHLRDTLKRIKSPHHLEDFFLSKLDQDDTEPNDGSSRMIGLADLVVPVGEFTMDEATIGLDPRSIMGLYVRKAQIEFRKLEFEEMCRFYAAFKAYTSSIGNSNHSKSRAQSSASKDPVVLSAFDMDKYLDLQTQKLSNPGQIDIPEDLMVHVRNIQSRISGLAKTHYITCLHAQQTGNFEIAIQSLYRFFDYSVASHDRVLYQYALLNLAMLHARFSHYEEAVTALREAIEVARDHMDQECLSYALNWLHRLTGAVPSTYSGANEAQGFANTDEMSSGQPFHYLRSLNELAVAKQMLQYYPSEIDMNDVAHSFSKTASDLALEGRFEEALRVIKVAKSRFPLNTMKATPWVQVLVQILQGRAMATNQIRDAEIWAQQLGITLVNTTALAAPSDSNIAKDSAAHQNQVDDTSREIQLEIILQKALLSALAGQRLSGIQQLSEGLAIVQQNQWPGMHKFTVMYLVALAEIYMESDSAMSAIPLLLTALTLSEHSLQRPLLLLVKLRLSEALLYLNSVQQAIALVDGIMTMVRCGFKKTGSLKEVTQVLYFQVRVYRELGSTDEIEETLQLFKTTSLQLDSARNKHEPSWYSYYYARDALEGILGSKDDNAGNPTFSTSNEGSSPKQVQAQMNSSGSLKRVGSTQWGRLKRTPSQLWQSTTASSYPTSLSPHEERDEEAGRSYEETDEDEDMNSESEGEGSKPRLMDGDDTEADPSQTKKRRIAEE